MWTLLAHALVVVHVGYLVYAALGGLLALHDLRWLVPHLATTTWGVVVVAMQWSCPLTMAEKSLIARSGEDAYPGSFLDHYVYGVVLPEGSQELVFGLQLALIAAVYVLVVRAALHRRPITPSRPGRTSAPRRVSVDAHP